MNNNIFGFYTFFRNFIIGCTMQFMTDLRSRISNKTFQTDGGETQRNNAINKQRVLNVIFYATSCLGGDSLL
jgi:hypothetical protein